MHEAVQKQTSPKNRRNKSLGLLIALFLVLSTIGVLATSSHSVQAASSRASNALVGGSGAALPYTELKAYNATTNGTISGVSYALGSVAFDAVDHQAVQLTQGQYVQFTLPQQANAINLRYSIPDSSSGGGINASLRRAPRP